MLKKIKILNFRENETPKETEARKEKDNVQHKRKRDTLPLREQKQRNAKSNAMREMKRQALDENELAELKTKEASMKKLNRAQR